MRKDYLVAYDYGSGAVWIVVSAPSAQAIEGKYPGLLIFQDRPPALSDDQYRELLQSERIDVEDEPPEWLRAYLKTEVGVRPNRRGL